MSPAANNAPQAAYGQSPQQQPAPPQVAYGQMPQPSFYSNSQHYMPPHPQQQQQQQGYWQGGGGAPRQDAIIKDEGRRK